MTQKVFDVPCDSPHEGQCGTQPQSRLAQRSLFYLTQKVHVRGMSGGPLEHLSS